MLFLAMMAGSVIGLYIRFSLRDFMSVDSYVYLLPWYEEIKANGGLQALKEQVGNYNVLYQFLIAIMTYLPIKSLYAYKLLSMMFDYLLAGAVAWLVYDVTEGENKDCKAALAYMCVILSPVVFLNSSAWAQCDSIYTFFVVIALVAFFKEYYVRAFILYGFAVAFKLQAVFLLPFFLFVYFAKKKFSILNFGIIPVVMCVSGLPGILMGRSVLDIFRIYLGQMNEWEKMSMNYPSFWLLLNDGAVVDSYATLKNVAIAITVTVLAAWMISWLVNYVKLDVENMMYMAFILCYTCVLFLPSMHERYGFIYEILAIVIAFLNKRTCILLLPLCSISMATYGSFLFSGTIDMRTLTILNVVVYVVYVVLLTRCIFEKKTA